MKTQFWRKLLAGSGVLALGLALAGGALGVSTAPVAAETYQGNIIQDYDTDDTEGQGVFLILNIILTVLTFGVATAGVLGLVICGIQYMTSQGDTAKMKTAKTRIIEIVIGLVAYALLYVVLNWLIPGGIGSIFA